jgi:hypothetical protein
MVVLLSVVCDDRVSVLQFMVCFQCAELLSSSFNALCSQSAVASKFSRLPWLLVTINAASQGT